MIPSLEIYFAVTFFRRLKGGRRLEISSERGVFSPVFSFFEGGRRSGGKAPPGGIDIPEWTSRVGFGYHQNQRTPQKMTTLRNCLFLALSIVIGSVGRISAVPAPDRIQDLDSYSQKLSTTDLAGLTFGPNAQSLFSRQSVVLVRMTAPSDSVYSSTSSRNGVVVGKIPCPEGMVDVLLSASIEGKQVETNMAAGRLDAMIYQWEENYAVPSALKDLAPKFKELTFREGEGLTYRCNLKGSYPYSFRFTIPYDYGSGKLDDVGPALKDVRKFVRSAERDERGNILLSNNKSGLFVFLFYRPLEKGTEVRAHHPMHDLIWNSDTGLFRFSYVDAVSDVQRIPEIRRLMGEPKFRQFVEAHQGCQVKVAGSPEQGFDINVFDAEAGNRMRISVNGRKISWAESE